MKLCDKYRANKYGELFFTFPDGEKVYKLKEDFHERLPREKLKFIEENTNFIAQVGVSANIIKVSMVKALELNREIKAHNDSKLDASKKIDEQHTVLKFVVEGTEMHMEKTEDIMVTMFDMFFFFEGENVFEQSEEDLEKKRHYLNEYPYYKGFFLRQLEMHSGIYRNTLNSVIQYAILQTSLLEAVRAWEFTNTSEQETTSTETS